MNDVRRRSSSARHFNGGFAVRVEDDPAPIGRPGLPTVGINRMTPSVLHVPPRLAALVSVCGDPPARSTRFSLVPSKKPTDRLSDDQNGKLAPSVPVNGCAVALSSDRSHSRDAPSPEATNTIWRPSGRV